MPHIILFNLIQSYLEWCTGEDNTVFLEIGDQDPRVPPLIFTWGHSRFMHHFGKAKWKSKGEAGAQKNSAGSSNYKYLRCSLKVEQQLSGRPVTWSENENSCSGCWIKAVTFLVLQALLFLSHLAKVLVFVWFKSKEVSSHCEPHDWVCYLRDNSHSLHLHLLLYYSNNDEVLQCLVKF